MEDIVVWQVQCFMCFGGQIVIDDQWNMVVGVYFVDQYIGFQFEVGQQFVGFVVMYFVFEWVNVDYVVYVQVRYINFDRQCVCIFYGVEENWCDFIVQIQVVVVFVWYVWDIVVYKLQY